MIRRLLSFSLTVLLCTSAALIVSNWLLQAAGPSGSTLTIMATVRPQRFIVVNRDLKIQAVLSNTDHNVRPTVYLDGIDGQEIPYSESIIEEYQNLKPSLNFSKPGILYERRNGRLQELVQVLKNWLPS